MSKKYNALAQEIIKLIGGSGNVKDAYHCQTRLRFHLIDDQKAQKDKINKLDGVTKVLESGGQFQVVIGPQVADVFEEIEKYIDVSGDNSEQPNEKKGFWNTVIDFVSNVFQPIIPALSGAGMIKALLALLIVFKLVTEKSQTYIILNMFADGIFYFLPVLLAYTEAKKLKCDPIIAVSVAVILLHPTFTKMVLAGKAVHLFGFLPVSLVNYAYSVIPIILIIFVQKYVEKFFHKVVPKAIELVFVPMLTILTMGILGLVILGPIGNIIGQGLAKVFTYLSVNASWVPALLVGGLLPIMVMFGIHNGIAPLGVVQLATKGFDSIFGPGCVVSNMAQATAGAVVAFRTKNKKEKTVAASGSITAYMGITEPILYGVNLPKRYPLIASMIGGACGGLYAGLTHTHRFATGSSGLPAILLYIGNNTFKYLINIIIAIVIAVVVTGILTLILSYKFEGKDDSQPNELISPVNGEAEPISNASDQAFSDGSLGKGIVVKNPQSNKVVAPISGTVTSLFPTLHAIGITSDQGIEVLIHIGINTVELKGKYFKAMVKQGDHVNKGQLLIDFDRKKIKEAGYSIETMMVITNSQNYKEVKLEDHNQKINVEGIEA